MERPPQIPVGEFTLRVDGIDARFSYQGRDRMPTLVAKAAPLTFSQSRRLGEMLRQHCVEAYAPFTLEARLERIEAALYRMESAGAAKE